MRTPSWETSAGALAAFLNSTTQAYMADLFTITLSGGGVLRYTSAQVAVTVNSLTYAAGPVITRGKTKLAVGIAVDTLALTLAGDASVTVNSTPMMQFIAAGGFDGAKLVLERAFAAGPPTADVQRNLINYTERFDNAAWVKHTYIQAFGAGSVANACQAPDGTMTADLIAETASTGIHYVYRPVTVVAGQNYVFSQHYKPSGRRYIRVSFVTGGSAAGCYCDVDLQTSTIINTGAIGAGTFSAATISAIDAFGFVRVSVSGSVPAAAGYLVSALRNASTNVATEVAQNYLGDGVSGICFWGGQFEQGTVATDYQRIDAAYAAPNPWVGTLPLFQGSISGPQTSRYISNMTVNSDSELLNVMVPRNVYAPGCMNTLFDATCGKSKAGSAAAVTATSATDAPRISFNSARADATGYFALGFLVGVTGANAGVGRTVKLFSGGTFQAIQPWPAAVVPGDTFTAYPGCDKTQATCAAKFANLPRFRGYPYIPAPESIT